LAGGGYYGISVARKGRLRIFTGTGAEWVLRSIATNQKVDLNIGDYFGDRNKFSI